MERIEKVSLEDAITIGVEMHKAGNFEEAGELYSKILEAEPDQPAALHFSGILKHQLGDSDEAVRLIRRAIEQISMMPRRSVSARE